MLEPWLHARLKQRAEAEGVSLSEVVRRGLAQWLSSDRPKDDPLMRAAGVFKDGTLDTTRLDDELYTKDW